VAPLLFCRAYRHPLRRIPHDTHELADNTALGEVDIIRREVQVSLLGLVLSFDSSRVGVIFVCNFLDRPARYVSVYVIVGSMGDSHGADKGSGSKSQAENQGLALHGVECV
jgi:hypothetical protein